MLVIREVMYCKPGKVRPLLEKFQAMNKLGARLGWPTMRIMTDVAGEQYWTLVAEMEIESMDEFQKMNSGEGQSEADGKEFEKIMAGYHDLVDHGKREIFKLESGG
jgi:hypothetical protein